MYKHPRLPPRINIWIPRRFRWFTIFGFDLGSAGLLLCYLDPCTKIQPATNHSRILLQRSPLQLHSLVQLTSVEYKTKTDRYSFPHPSLWSQVTESYTPDQITYLVDSLGIEMDSEEHLALERGPLCMPVRMTRIGPSGGGGVRGKGSSAGISKSVLGASVNGVKG